MNYSAFIAIAMEHASAENTADVETLVQGIEAQHGVAFYAPRYWPTSDTFAPPKEAYEICEKGLIDSKVFVFYYPKKVPSGAVVELGLALSLRMPIVVYTEDEKNLPYFVRGGVVRVVTSFAEVLPAIDEAFEALKSKDLHQALIDTQSLLHVSVAGGCTDFLKRIDVPGSSAYLMGTIAPHNRTQMHNFLGHVPEGAGISAEVALDMAMTSYSRATEVQVKEGLAGNPVGIGITAAIATSRVPKGDQRAHVAIITKSKVIHKLISLEKGQGLGARRYHGRTIADETAQLLLQALLDQIPSDEALEETALERFYRYPIFATDGTRKTPEERERSIYLPATLNPIHDGHRALCQIAEDELSPLGPGRIKATYLVSSVSPHKGRLSVQDMLFKAGMLRAERWLPNQQARTVEFTRDEPLFIDKARKRPGCIFLIGSDTMQRMLDPSWGIDVNSMLNEMKNLGVKFYVMGRLIKGTDDKEHWVTCRDVSVSWLHQNVFQPLQGRVDISSTAIREGKSA